MVLDVHRMTEHDAPSGTQPLRRQRLRVLELTRRIRARNVAPALPRQRQKRIGSRWRRPALRGKTRDPESVERQTGRLEDAENLDRGFRLLRLEQRIVRKGAKRGRCLGMA